ncbi:MAG: hypothetical protein HYU36_08170 [Planctomycetes bacterium]|nr:hypothetical protein [Planctomycetota bacterium]
MRSSFPYLLVATLLAAGLSAGNLTKELWFDEAYTLGHFIARGFFGVFTDYHSTNNHILFTFLLVGWVKLHLLLDWPEWCLRLLPWSFALASVACLHAAVHAWRGPLAAFYAAVLLGTSHVFLNFSCQVRGYSLSALETSLALWLILRLLERPTRIGLAAYALVALLAVGTIPTNVLPLSALAAWGIIELVHRGALKSAAGLRAAAVIALAPPSGLLWYLWHPRVRSQFLQLVPSEPASFTAATRVWADLGYALLTDLLWLTPLFIGGVLLLGLRPDLDDERSRPRPGYFLLAALTPLLLVFRFNSLSLSRVFFPFFPWWFAGLGIALDEACRRLARRWPRLGQPLRLLILGVAALAACREATFVTGYRERLASERPQGVYDQYYQVDFSPHGVIDFLSRAGDSGPGVALTDESDHYALKFHAFLYEFAPLYSAGGVGSREAFADALASGRDVYLVSNGLLNAWSMLAKVTEKEFKLDDLALVRDTGFFKIYVLPRQGLHP